MMTASVAIIRGLSSSSGMAVGLGYKSPVALVSWTAVASKCERESSALSFILNWRLRGHLKFSSDPLSQV